ncbi:hypothetical protein BLA29_010412, partial [Euroglyphus maynei]
NVIKYGLQKNKKLKGYKVENVITNDRVKIKSDVPILTENQIQCNKPDLFVHDLKENEITLIEVGITNKVSLPTTEITKSRKYELLAGELRSMNPGAKVKQVPVVLAWDALVTKHFTRHMAKLGLNERIQAYIQTEVLRRTCQSVLIDFRNRGDFLPEMEELFLLSEEV